MPDARQRHQTILALSARVLAAAAALTAAAALVLVAQPAHAHGGLTSAPQAVSVTIGDLEVRTVIGAVTVVPSVMLVDVSLLYPGGDRADEVQSGAVSAPSIELRAWPADADRPEAPQATLQTIVGDRGPYPAQFKIDRAGPWEIEILLAGSSSGVSTARIPITVVVATGDPSEPARSIAYLAAGVLAIGGIALATAASRRWPRVSSFALNATAPATVAALAVAVTLSVVAVSPPATTVSTAPMSLPHVNVLVTTLNGPAIAGQPAVVEFLLVDGSTGLMVDSITPHHEALLHLALMGDSPLDFAHVHPARVAPGRYLLEWTPRDSGEHAVQVELTRESPNQAEASGSQVIQSQIDVLPAQSAGQSSMQIPDMSDAIGGLGEHAVDDLVVTIEATGALVTGRPIGFSATIESSDGELQLQPWLGMKGHLMIRERSTGLFAHVHSVGPMSAPPRLAAVESTPGDPLSRSLPTPSVPSDEPSEPLTLDSAINFAYTFPLPGTYDAWVQFGEGDRVVTVPMTLEVSS